MDLLYIILLKMDNLFAHLLTIILVLLVPFVTGIVDSYSNSLDGISYKEEPGDSFRDNSYLQKPIDDSFKLSYNREQAQLMRELSYPSTAYKLQPTNNLWDTLNRKSPLNSKQNLRYRQEQESDSDSSYQVSYSKSGYSKSAFGDYGDLYDNSDNIIVTGDISDLYGFDSENDNGYEDEKYYYREPDTYHTPIRDGKKDEEFFQEYETLKNAKYSKALYDKNGYSRQNSKYGKAQKRYRRLNEQERSYEDSHSKKEINTDKTHTLIPNVADSHKYRKNAISSKAPSNARTSFRRNRNAEKSGLDYWSGRAQNPWSFHMIEPQSTVATSGAVRMYDSTDGYYKQVKPSQQKTSYQTYDKRALSSYSNPRPAVVQSYPRQGQEDVRKLGIYETLPEQWYETSKNYPQYLTYEKNSYNAPMQYNSLAHNEHWQNSKALQEKSSAIDARRNNKIQVYPRVKSTGKLTMPSIYPYVNPNKPRVLKNNIKAGRYTSSNAYSSEDSVFSSGNKQAVGTSSARRFYKVSKPKTAAYQTRTNSGAVLKQGYAAPNSHIFHSTPAETTNDPAGYLLNNIVYTSSQPVQYYTNPVENMNKQAVPYSANRIEAGQPLEYSVHTVQTQQPVQYTLSAVETLPQQPLVYGTNSVGQNQPVQYVINAVANEPEEIGPGTRNEQALDPCVSLLEGDYVLKDYFALLFPYADALCSFVKCANNRAYVNPCSTGTKNEADGSGYCGVIDLTGECGYSMSQAARTF